MPSKTHPPQVLTPMKSALVSPLPTPSYPTGGVFSVLAQTTIAASPVNVLLALLDTSSYPKWNTFIPRVTISADPSSMTFRTEVSKRIPSRSAGGATLLAVGTEVIFDVHMKGPDNPSRASAEQVTVVEELKDGRRGYRVAWKMMGWGDRMLRAERVNEIVEAADGHTTYRTWETFAGPMAYVVKIATGKDLVARFQDWATDLTKYVEGMEEAEVVRRKLSG